VSPILGERRFVSAVAKRLQSLGALTQGDRSATAGSSSLSVEEFNIDNKYGQKALQDFYSFLIDFNSKQRTREVIELDEDLIQELQAEGWRREDCTFKRAAKRWYIDQALFLLIIIIIIIY
jgi:hypothetical protein